MSLAAAHPDFQAKIRAIAAVGRCMTEAEVYVLWRDYSRKCTDQSAVLTEFVEWYHIRLGATKTALLSAIGELHG
jgi:hypothetical protein